MTRRRSRGVTLGQVIAAVESDRASLRRHLSQVVEQNQIRLASKIFPDDLRASAEKELEKYTKALEAFDRGEQVDICGNIGVLGDVRKVSRIRGRR